MIVRKRLDIKGSAIVFVTTTVFEWKSVLTQNKVVRIFITELENLTSLYEISIISYVIMPSHVHLLLGFPKIEILSKMIQMFKSLTSRQVKELEITELKENDYKLWKPRFDDLIITTPKQVMTKMEYIHYNPVKNGPAARPNDYAHSSFESYLKKGLYEADWGDMSLDFDSGDFGE